MSSSSALLAVESLLDHRGYIELSAEQRDNNLGIDSDLRNRDPAAYAEALRRKLTELDEEWGIQEPVSNDLPCPPTARTNGQTEPPSPHLK